MEEKKSPNENAIKDNIVIEKADKKERYFNNTVKMGTFTELAFEIIKSTKISSERKKLELGHLLNASKELLLSTYFSLKDTALSEEFFEQKTIDEQYISISGPDAKGGFLKNLKVQYFLINIATLALLSKEYDIFKFLVQKGVKLFTSALIKFNEVEYNSPDALLLACIIPDVQKEIVQIIINALDTSTLEKLINKTSGIRVQGDSPTCKIILSPLIAAILANKEEVAIQLLLHGADVAPALKFFTENKKACSDSFLKLLSSANELAKLNCLRQEEDSSLTEKASKPMLRAQIKVCISQAYLIYPEFVFNFFQSLVDEFLLLTNINEMPFLLKELYEITENSNKDEERFHEIAVMLFNVPETADLSNSFGSRQKMEEFLDAMLINAKFNNTRKQMRSSSSMLNTTFSEQPQTSSSGIFLLLRSLPGALNPQASPSTPSISAEQISSTTTTSSSPSTSDNEINNSM